MKKTEITHYVKVVEYRSSIDLLRACLDSFHGCYNDEERRGWRTRALEQLSKATSLRCHRAKPADRQKFESICELLQQCINTVSPDGQLCHAAP